MPRPGSRTLIFALTAGLLFFGAGCSGGGDDDGGGGPVGGGGLRANAITLNTNFLNSFGVVGVSFTISGPANTPYDLLTEYLVSGSALTASASQVSQALANQINAMNPGAGVGQIATMGLILPATDGGGGGDVTSAPFTFWWHAYADLGFLSSNVNFRVTPFSNGNPATPNGLSADSSTIQYNGAPTSGASSGSTGPGAGDPTMTGAPSGATSQGRAGHTATAVRGGPAPKSSGLNLLVAGGYTAATGPNAFESMDRVALDTNNFTHTIPFSGTMTPATTQRVLHASSFFIDPTNGAVKVLTTGGVDDCDPTGADLMTRIANATAEQATGNVYCFSPLEQVTQVNNSMVAGARFEHSSTWVPCNQVIIIGGCQGLTSPTAIASIEHYDPVSNSFFQPNSTATGMPASLGAGQERCGHESALMSDGRVFIGGGYNPATMTPMPCLIYDPISGDTTVAAGGSTSIMLIDHTVTRMANGWILIVGGRSPATNALSATAYVYKPESDTIDQIATGEARMMHAATLLGDKNVLVTGGVTDQGGTQGFTTSAQVFSVNASYTAGFTSTTLYNALNDARAEHTATATDCGAVFVIGGRNDVGGGVNFLDSLEFFAFSNEVPTVTQAMTANYNMAGSTIDIDIDVADADADGGYVIIRFANITQATACMTATITAQSPSSAGGTTPNMEVSVGSYTFTWDYANDGVNPGDTVEIEIIPVGAVIGSPTKITAQVQ